ncbi:hypothetical protein OQA88_11429 [Cercophora sp. LCS_1]
MASRGRRMPWPEQQQQQQQQQKSTAPSRAAAVAAQSRFVEGSMNDRISAAPPPNFLGPNELAAYEQQFYDADRHRHLRPVSSAGHYRHNQSEQQQQQQQQQRGSQKPEQSRKGRFWDGVWEKLHLTRSRSSVNFHENNKAATTIPAEGPTDNGTPMAYPTREEVMQSYKNLMASGFFESHVIHGTRHPLRTTVSNDGGRPSTAMGPPPPSKQSFANHISARQTEPLGFSAVPYSSTNPAELPSSVAPPRRPTTSDNPFANSPQRGIKRSADREPETTTTETGARKLVKKLRRTASRLSTEVPNPPAAPTTNLFTINPFKPRPSTSSNSSFVAPPPAKLTKPRGRGTLSGPRMRVRSRSRSRSRPRSRPRTPARRDITPSPLNMNPVGAAAPVFSPPPVDDAMLVDSPPPSPVRQSMERPTTALAPPSFHYPLRRRPVGEPLKVVPNLNRGIPGVPPIPAEFGGKQDAKMGGSRDSGLGEEVENVAPIW